nr:hypothetical protein [Tanacetum cinerariifolium]
MSKGKSEKRLVAESYDWDEAVSSKDEGVTKVKAFMAIAEDELSVENTDARSNYTHVDLHYVEDQRKNLLSKFKSLNQKLSSYIEKWTSSKVTLDQLLTEQVPGIIVRALRRRGKRKDTISSKEVLFTKAYESPSKIALEITSNSKSECENLEPLPPLPTLLRVEPNGTSSDVSPYLPVPVPESFHEQTDEELTENDIKRMYADDQAIQAILLGLPEDVYVAVDSCETTKEIWECVRQMMKGSDIGEQEKKAKLFNEWEKFTSTDGESI